MSKPTDQGTKTAEDPSLLKAVNAAELERRVAKLEDKHAESEEKLLERHTKQITIIFSCMAGFITVCAILITLIGWFSRNESKDAAKELKAEVEKSVAAMETKFQKLAGEALRRPRVEILTRGGMLDGQLRLITPGGLAEWGSLFIRNSGDRKTDPLSIRLFASRPISPPVLGVWMDVPSLDKDYPKSYFLTGVGQVWVEAKETWVISDPFSIGIGGETNILCKLQVFYGGEEPAEAKFQLAVRR